MSGVATSLWFVGGNGHAAARSGRDLLAGSQTATVMPDPDGAVVAVACGLTGTRCPALNGGPRNRADEAASIAVGADDQAKSDRLREALRDGGTPSRRASPADRSGTGPQIAPKGLRAMEATGTIDFATLHAAVEGRA